MQKNIYSYINWHYRPRDWTILSQIKIDTDRELHDCTSISGDIGQLDIDTLMLVCVHTKTHRSVEKSDCEVYQRNTYKKQHICTKKDLVGN